MSLYPQFTLSGLRADCAKERAVYENIRNFLTTLLEQVPSDGTRVAADLKAHLEGVLHDAEAFCALDLIDSDERKHVEAGVFLLGEMEPRPVILAGPGAMSGVVS